MHLYFQINVNQYDNSPVLLNDKTKWITIVKTTKQFANPNGIWNGRSNRNRNPFVSFPVYTTVQVLNFELNEHGMADIAIPTTENENAFQLDVSGTCDFEYCERQHFNE